MTKPPEGSTYVARARADAAQLASGRFKDEASAKVPAVPIYPAQPSGSPWSGDDLVGKEPPLGFKIDQMSEGDG
jgi:hypothetical protein